MTERAPWQTHFGFTRSPFGKSLAPSELFTRAPHEEAVARIRHCISREGAREPDARSAEVDLGLVAGLDRGL